MVDRKYRKYTKAFRESAVRRFRRRRTCRSYAGIWASRASFCTSGGNVGASGAEARSVRRSGFGWRERATEEGAGRRTLEVDFFKAACTRSRLFARAVPALAKRHLSGPGTDATAGSLGVEPMCRLAGVSRAGFYRFLQQRHPERGRHGSAFSHPADRPGTQTPLWLSAGRQPNCGGAAWRSTISGWRG